MAKKSLDRKRGTSEPTESGFEGRCPIINTPFDDCFITSLNSQNIDLTIHYCGGNHAECEIFNRVRKGCGKEEECEEV